MAIVAGWTTTETGRQPWVVQGLLRTADAVSPVTLTEVTGTFEDTITVPPWKKKPSRYQISSQDRMIAPENQERMSARIGARKIVTLEVGHASLMTRPVQVAELIDEAVTEVAVSSAIEDAVDEAGIESFPASDPPAWAGA